MGVTILLFYRFNGTPHYGYKSSEYEIRSTRIIFIHKLQGQKPWYIFKLCKLLFLFSKGWLQKSIFPNHVAIDNV